MESVTARMIEALKASIPRKRFTQKEVERLLELSPGYLSRLFGGQIDLKLDHVAQIARVIGVDPEDIIHEAFPISKVQENEAQRLRDLLGIASPEPAPTLAGSPIEREIERIVRRVLDSRSA